jgi:hypothetical protein
MAHELTRWGGRKLGGSMARIEACADQGGGLSECLLSVEKVGYAGEGGQWVRMGAAAEGRSSRDWYNGLQRCITA